MRFRAIASDYDGTLAQDGRVDRDTLAGLKRARESGRKLILVTGRELPSLRSVFSSLDLFDWIVAENGALIHNPGTGDERLLCPAVSGELVAICASRGFRFPWESALWPRSSLMMARRFVRSASSTLACK